MRAGAIGEEMPMPAEAGGKLSVGDLVRMFEDSEDATLTARGLSERDRDYYDNIQLTAAEISALKKRGQPQIIINRIKDKIDFLIGLEKQQRIDPRAFPRTPMHEQDADGVSQALKYVTDEEDYDHKRSGVWKNLCIEGAGGIGVKVEESFSGYGRSQMMASTSMSPPQPDYKVKLYRIAWDRMFWDPHSSEPDFSDAGYLGVVLWMDIEDAKIQYGDEEDILDATMADAGHIGSTYDDKPKWRLWADKKRKRIRIVQMWMKRGDEWWFVEFTKLGILKAGPSPYVTDQGESDCELVFQSAYVNRENERYGIVREMISPQDEINKRRSKALHLLSTAQVWYEDGMIGDVEKVRREAARADGVIKLPPGALSDGRVKIETRTDLAAGQVQLLQEAKNEIDLKGPNATMLGDKAGGSSSASGKAIIASQQGGMTSLGDLMDNLRHMDKRVFRAVWYRIRQFWTAEKWIRTTDDERNVKWVAMNVPPEQMEMLAAQNPEFAQMIAGQISNVAELDCDIIIDEVPDAITPALEQWQGLVELAKAGVQIPPDVLIQSAPNLKNKDKLIERLEQPNPQAQQAQELQVAKAMADIKETIESAFQKHAQGEKALVEASLAPAHMIHGAEMDQANLEQQGQRDQMTIEQKRESEMMRAQQKQQQAPQAA